MSNFKPVDRTAAEQLFSQFAPMFQSFEDAGADYCLVGGLAVVAHCLSKREGHLRATRDADMLIPMDYPNSEFAKRSLSVYAADPKYGEAIYNAILDPEGFTDLCQEENSFVNISFVGADADIDGIDTPDFGVCRVLSGRTLASIDRTRVEVCGLEL